MSSRIETVLQEKPRVPAVREFVKQANIPGMEAYRKLVAEAERDFEGFWGRLARETLIWSKPFSKVLDESKAPFFRWFYDGELNASYNCLDRHLKTQPDKVAIIFEADDGKVTRITYKQLYHDVCRLANALHAHGIKQGRPGAHLHADVDPGRGRDAGLRAHRRHATRWCSAASPRRACRSASSTPVPPRSSPPTGSTAAASEIPEARGRRSFRHGRLREREERHRLQAHRQRVPMQAPRDKWWDDVVKGRPSIASP